MNTANTVYKISVSLLMASTIMSFRAHRKRAHSTPKTQKNNSFCSLLHVLDRG